MNSLINKTHLTVRSSEKVPYSGFFRRFWFGLFLMTVVAGMKLSAQDEIQVGGTLTENEVWTPDHIYIVYKDLRIPDTVTLIIQAGVTVKVDQGRGVFVLGGNLYAEGNENDSVIFRANYTREEKDWYWKGINYTGVGDVGENSIYYTKIIDAETGIDSYNSEDVVIKNSTFLNSQNIGIRLFNSRNCQIVDCQFINNYDGIEMVATDGEEASGNTIAHCILNNENHNVYLLKAYGGILINNLLENNLIENGNNGIWLDNGGGEAFGRNMIRKNIIMLNGSGAGYGLMVGQDSIDVQYNIFWKNHIAVFFDQETAGSVVMNNSFYQNEDGILISAASVENEFYHNTFSENVAGVFKLRETQGTAFRRNNIFTFPGQEAVVINYSPDDILLTENYWHDTIEENIRQLIWDQEDDPALGEVIISPFLQAADTVNPVVPPMNLIKQQVDGKVKVSWAANPETDLWRYRVYYGEFKNYVFPHVEDAGKDTVFFMTGIDSHDTIAATALDSAFVDEDGQVLGHESPFAFAEIYPYAGADDIICKMHVQFPLLEATVPYDYDDISWTSSGDGLFNDGHILNPVYYPGPNDKEQGKVILTISVTADETVKKDSLLLYIFDDPVVYAGNDTTILADEQLSLSSSGALYYEALFWSTTGDGTFDNDTILHPEYTPGQEDLAVGEVQLILTAVSECGSSNDTLTLHFEPVYSVEGNVWHNGAPVRNGVVLAMKDNPEGARAVDLAQTGTDGKFRLARVTAGDYVLYAVPDTITAGEAVPGYYANKLRWQDAWNFHINANTYDVDIMLPSVDYVLPEGEGAVSGYFVLPDVSLFTKDIYCNSWFEPVNTLTYCDGGLSNITVFLYNSTGAKLLDYTLTDENGNFHFGGLPYGGYLIDAEKAGYETTVSSLIQLSPDHRYETGVEIELTGHKKIGIHRKDDMVNMPKTKVYPNPATDYINLALLPQTDGQVEIYIYNSLGQLTLYKKTAIDDKTSNLFIRLNINRLTSGIFFGRIVSGSTVSNFSFIRN